MSGCCDPQGCDAVFTPQYASESARRYRRAGLDPTARRMVDFVTDRGVAGATVLEIGGGIGSLHLELLLRGAARATNVELSDVYEREAAALVAEAGVADRVERRTADIAVAPDAVDAADVVVLHRVVCCYPDHRALLVSAADHARRVLVFSHPRSGPVARLVTTGENAMHWLRGREFRTFVHSPSDMVDTVRSRGHEVVHTHRERVWHVVGAERT